ncbi:hypothetical protein NLG97_g5152 [Lecanicillium saksenae]|uniref:Uncharacterized protein n=1 Tax=Lecanicillium saksenae TaxID=468837 RepID=A0ACC1QTT2_9HYPO|nr:hypothetical protein NLG97_g5152 [Lecanicillium saksenae]
MSYYQPTPQVSPNREEEVPWISPMSSMNFDEQPEESQHRRLSAFSFSLAPSHSVGERETNKWRQSSAESQPLKVAAYDGTARDSSSADIGSAAQHNANSENPLGLDLSHQSGQFSIHRVPVPRRPVSIQPQVSAPDPSKAEIRNEMPSPDETLIGDTSPRRTSIWGRLWSFHSTSLGRKKSGSDLLTMNMQPISGAERGSMIEEGSNVLSSPEGYIPKQCYEPCSSRKDVQLSARHWLTKVVIAASLYSTIMSGIWLFVAIVQPRWGRKISSNMGLGPSTATVLAAFLSKTIELTFVTTFITFLGQVLTRRAIARESRGTTLAEMSMRSWVIQPGSLITHFGMLRFAGLSILGVLSLLATLVAAFYTTASDAMVAPKLKYGNWEHALMSGYVRSSYANAKFVQASCPVLFVDDDPTNGPNSCTEVMVSGESYRNLQNFMGVWNQVGKNGSAYFKDLKNRPAATASLNGNTTLFGTWIETEHGDLAAHFKETGRIINNVTLAMPHPGVAAAAISPLNGILQPDDLSGVGEYAIKAGVVSPSVNVMCVNMNTSELAPLVYTEWPNANVTRTGVKEQVIGWSNWTTQVPPPITSDGKDEYLNRTVVDDIFRWGPKYKRKPPVFQLFPADFNTVTNSTIKGNDATHLVADAIYIMGKNHLIADYTLCELRSWVSPKCSTQFNISGIAGSKMAAHCEDPNDANNYRRSFDAEQDWGYPVPDWKWLADQWRLSSDLNGGVLNSNPSNGRILTQLAVAQPALLAYQPSMAEALAVFASSTLVLGAVGTPFVHYWEYEVPDNMLGTPGALQQFNASVITQQYTSGHVYRWQGIFYLILAIMFALNILCFVYIVLHARLVTDYTEAHNLFSLALNSAPNHRLKGTCGGGPEGHDLAVPWRVAYASGTNHYHIEETSSGSWIRNIDGRNGAGEQTKSSRLPGESYSRLLKGRSWV